MSKQPLFNKVLQIAVVVEDLEASMRYYWEDFGIGPWTVYTFDPDTVKDMIIRDEKVDYAMKLALTDIGGVQWELIEPLDDKSIYADFLKEHGEGLHHVAFGVEDYDGAMAQFRERGMGVLQGGTWHGFTYTYLDTGKKMATIAEIYNPPPDFQWPTPDTTYP